MSALSLTAAQASSLGQEKAVVCSGVTSGTAFQAVAGPVGIALTKRSASLPVTQRADEEQETPKRGPKPPAGAAATQVGAPPAGSVVLTMLPSLLTATQRDSLGQETPVSSSGRPSLRHVPDGRPGGVGRGDDRPSGRDADAERDRRAGDAIGMDPRLVFALEGDRRPGRGAAARVGRRIDIALAAHRGAEFGRRAGDAAHLGAGEDGVGVTRLNLFGAVEMGHLPGRGPCGRVVGAGQGAVAADDDADRRRGAGGSVQGRRLFREPGHVPLQSRGRGREDGERAGDQRCEGRKLDSPRGDRPLPSIDADGRPPIPENRPLRKSFARI